MKFTKALTVISLLIAVLLTMAAARVDLGIAVGGPPPPPPVTAVAPVGVAPAPGYVWVPGHWDWVGGNWVWVEGRWILPPKPRGAWVAPSLEFRWHRGHWR
jgi:hypothetical protein